MKQLLEGNELLLEVPDCHSTGKAPVVHLANGLTLDEDNCFSSPTLIIGSTGSGKSTLMSQFRRPVLKQAKSNGDIVVTFCAKPEMLKEAEEEDVIISITSKKPVSCWNIFLEPAHSENPYITLREITETLFAEAREKTTQLFFPNAARDLFYGTCCYMFDYGRANNIVFTNADLVEFLETTPVHGTPDCPGWIDLADKFPEYFGSARDYIGENGSDQGLGVLSELRTLISSVFYGSFAAEGTFSAIGTLKEGGRNIYVHYDYANAGYSSLIVLKVIIELLLKRGMSQSSNHKVWFFLDEFSLLPKIRHTLTDALSLGRDPGSNGKGGVRIIAAIQSAQLMCKHYTPTEAKTLLSLFPNMICLRVMDEMSREIISSRYGKAHYIYTIGGIGDKTNVIHSVENVISDTHFSMITKKGQAICSLPAISSHPFFFDGYRKEYE